MDPPETQYNPQNQTPMVAPTAEVPINRNGNMAYQERHLQQPIDPSSSVNISTGYPKGGIMYEELLVATKIFSAQNFLRQGGFGFVHGGILSDHYNSNDFR
jgi:hypothetical protein